MNIDLIYISPLSGAVIGYFTNWLAIKMLFRPHSEKRLFGIRLPFTPGLIPKERARLAASFGRAIEEHLLTGEALTRRFTSRETLDGVGVALDSFVAALRAEERTISEAAAGFIDNETFLNGAAAGSIQSLLVSALDKTGANLSAAALIEKILSEPKTPREILPDETVISIKKTLASLLPRAAETLAALILSPENDARLRELTYRVIDDNITGLVSIFINRDRAYKSIKDGALDYFSSPESLAAITMKMWALTDKLLDTPVRELFNLLPAEIRAELTRLGDFAGGALERILPAVLGRAADKIAGLKISAVTERLTAGYEAARPAILDLAAVVIKRFAVYAAGRLGLGRVAEEQMNGMDVAQAEKIVLSVCGRELKAITWLGGILGFFIGLMPILFKIIGG